MDFEDSKAKAQKAELARQIAAMKDGLARIEGKLKPRHVFDTEEISLKQGLRKETDTILNLQAEQQQIVTECTKEMMDQDAIKCAEEGKLKGRLAEKTQFCNAVEVQNQVLKQDLGKCGQLAGIGQRPSQAPAAPAGLVPPVPMRDEEMYAVHAPAPAPVPLAYY